MKAIHIQLVTATIASTIMIPYGEAGGWIMAIIPKLEGNETSLHLNSDEIGWVTAFPSIFLTVGAIIAKFTADSIGRRNSLIVSMIPVAIGYSIMEFNTYGAMLVGRALSGVTNGFVPIFSLYIGEIADESIRGRLNLISNIVNNLSNIPVLLVSPFITLQELHMIIVIPSIIIMFLLFFIPESAHFYIMKGEMKKAERTVCRLREPDEVKDELANIKTYVMLNDSKTSNFTDLWRNRGSRRAFILLIWMVTYQQFSGISAIKDYAGLLFKESNPLLDENIEMVITLGVTVIASCLSTLYIDRFGRRLILFTSSLAFMIALLAMASFFCLQATHSISNYSWIPLISLIIMNAARSAGFRPLIYVLMSEYYPLKVKATAVTTVYFVGAITESINLKLFQIMSDALGFGPVLFICLIIYTVGTLIMYIFMPETKNLSLMEVEQLFERGWK